MFFRMRGQFVSFRIRHGLVESLKAFLLGVFFQFSAIDNGGSFYKKFGIFLVQSEAFGFSNVVAIAIIRTDVSQPCASTTGDDSFAIASTFSRCRFSGCFLCSGIIIPRMIVANNSMRMAINICSNLCLLHQIHR